MVEDKEAVDMVGKNGRLSQMVLHGSAKHEFIF